MPGRPDSLLQPPLPDAVLADRLRARPSWRGWTEQRIVQHQRFAATLRARIRPTFDTSLLSADAVADRVAEWVHGLLASAAPGDTAIAAPAGD
jgi:hypothetical protein